MVEEFSESVSGGGDSGVSENGGFLKVGEFENVCREVKELKGNAMFFLDHYFNEGDSSSAWSPVSVFMMYDEKNIADFEKVVGESYDDSFFRFSKIQYSILLGVCDWDVYSLDGYRRSHQGQCVDNLRRLSSLASVAYFKEYGRQELFNRAFDSFKVVSADLDGLLDYLEGGNHLDLSLSSIIRKFDPCELMTKEFEKIVQEKGF